MSIPAIVLLVFYVLHLLLYARLHGHTVVGKFNFWGALMSTSIIVALLAWGGFFS